MEDKYRIYGIWFDNGLSNRPINDLVKVHVGRPVSFRTMCEQFIFAHPELTITKTNIKLETRFVSGVQKIPNGNTPDYELTADGRLIEVRS